MTVRVDDVIWGLIRFHVFKGRYVPSTQERHDIRSNIRLIFKLRKVGGCTLYWLEKVLYVEKRGGVI